MQTFQKNLDDVMRETDIPLAHEEISVVYEAYVRTLMPFDQSGHRTVSGKHPICVALVYHGATTLIETSSQFNRLTKYKPSLKMLPGALHEVPDGCYRVYVKQSTLPTAKGLVNVLVPFLYTKFKVEAAPVFKMFDIKDYFLCAHDNVGIPAKECRSCKGAGIFKTVVN